MANSALQRIFLTRLLTMTNGESVELEALRGSLRVTSEAFDSLIHQLSDEGLLSLVGEIGRASGRERVSCTV
jgi:hypothetical protein